MTKKGLAPALAIAAALNVGQAEALSPNVEGLREGVKTELIEAMTQMQIEGVREEIEGNTSVGFLQTVPYPEEDPPEPKIIMADASGMTGTMTDIGGGKDTLVYDKKDIPKGAVQISGDLNVPGDCPPGKGSKGEGKYPLCLAGGAIMFKGKDGKIINYIPNPEATGKIAYSKPKTGETATIECDLNGDGVVKGVKERTCEIKVGAAEARQGAAEARQGAAEARKRGEALEAESRMVQKKIDRTIDEILKKTGG